MITERTLKKWRKEALYRHFESSRIKEEDKEFILITDQERILRLTQELLDQHLLRKG